MEDETEAAGMIMMMSGEAPSFSQYPVSIHTSFFVHSLVHRDNHPPPEYSSGTTHNSSLGFRGGGKIVYV